MVRGHRSLVAVLVASLVTAAAPTIAGCSLIGAGIGSAAPRYQAPREGIRGLHIDEESYNTLGGYVLGRLGRRARVGDRFDVEGRTLRVEALDGLRVARVYLSKGRGDRGQAVP